MSDGLRNEILVGDALERLQEIPDESIQCCVTGPPYYKLRDYGMEKQIGLEETADEYIEKLVFVFREVRRVLKPKGTLWLNLADTYENKNLLGVPWRVALALQEDSWWLRSDVIWDKPNATPSPVTDRPTTAHEYIFLLSKSARYYYDKGAILEPHSKGPQRTYARPHKEQMASGPMARGREGFNHQWQDPDRVWGSPEGRNCRSVWHIPTTVNNDAHFATMPEDLPALCIKASSKKGDLVLDPFTGLGTTLAVAFQLGRDFIGIELNPTYAALAQDRVGLASELREHKDVFDAFGL